MITNKVSLACSDRVSFTRIKTRKLQAEKEALAMQFAIGDTYNGKDYSIKEPMASNSSMFDMAFEFVRSKKRKKKNQDPVVINEGKYGTEVKFRSTLDKQLKATPNVNLRAELAKTSGIYDLDKAELRISSLSRYLKEDMVGFIIPAGHQWFDGSLENIIHGAKAKRVPQKDFQKVAKEFWSLLAKADPYWSSQQFIDYLGTVKDTPARNATIEAIKEIKEQRESKGSNISFGYDSALKDIKKLLKDGCAYTGVPMERHSRDQRRTASAEHIFPHSKGGQNSDFNYLITAARPNQDRGNMPLLMFLKGKDA